MLFIKKFKIKKLFKLNQLNYEKWRGGRGRGGGEEYKPLKDSSLVGEYTTNISIFQKYLQNNDKQKCAQIRDILH